MPTIQDSRILTKSSTVSDVVPTIPATNDHTDSTWLTTDIYKGELFINQADNKVFTRTDSGIIEITNPSVDISGKISLDGSSDPTTGKIKIGDNQGLVWGGGSAGEIYNQAGSLRLTGQSNVELRTGGTFDFYNAGGSSKVSHDYSLISTDYQASWPNKSGPQTIAMLSDISGGTTYTGSDGITLTGTNFTFDTTFGDGRYYIQSAANAKFLDKTATIAANLIYAGPAAGASAAPTFRSLALADMPVFTGYPVPANGTIGASDTAFTAIQKLDAYNISPKRLRSYQTKAAYIANNVNATLAVSFIGDSVAGDFILPAVNAFHQGHGYGGQHGGGAQTGVGFSYAGGARVVGAPVLITSLTRSGTTATATSAGHGLSNGASITISGATDTLFNGVKTISNVTTNTFDYTVSASAVTPDPSATIYFTEAADFNKWLLGTFSQLPSASSITWFRGTNATLPNTIATIAKVFYVKEVGAGTFKVQTSPDGTTWTDLSGYTSISCVDTVDNLGIVTAPITALSGQFQIRVVGVSGTCKIIGMGTETAKGAKISYLLSYGGLQMKDMVTTPARIWKAYLADLNPDIIGVMFKDGLDAALQASWVTIQGYINEVAPQCSVIWAGGTYGPEEEGLVAGTSIAPTNALLKAFVDNTSIAGDKYYFDAPAVVGKWSDAGRDGAYDQTPPISITSTSISGTTATVVTTLPHNLSTDPSGFIRINNVADILYNGLYKGITVINSTTFTYAVVTPPSGSSTGGTCCKVDQAHLSYGRNILSAAFFKEYGLFSGLGTVNYPWKLGSDLLIASGVPVLSAANTWTGLNYFTNTDDVVALSSNSAFTGGTAAIKVTGGIYSQKKMRADGGFVAYTTGAVPSMTLNNTFNGTNIPFGLQSVSNHAVSTSSTVQGVGVNAQVLVSTSGSATNNTSDNAPNAGITVNAALSGNGGAVGCLYGASIGYSHQGSQTLSNLAGLRMDAYTSGPVTTFYGINLSTTITGTNTNTYGVFLNANYGTGTGTNKFGFYNASTATNVTLGKSFLGTTNATYRLTNAGSDVTTGHTFIDPNNSLTSGNSWTFDNTNGLVGLLANGTRRIAGYSFSMVNTTTTSGSESADLAIKTQSAGGGLTTRATVNSTGISTIHLQGSTSTPTIAAGAGAGTTPTIAVAGSDMGGYITLTTGTLPTLSAVVSTVTFNVTYASAPRMISLTPANNNAAMLSGVNMVFVDQAGITTTTFDVTAGTTALTAATTYKWYYTVIQ